MRQRLLAVRLAIAAGAVCLVLTEPAAAGDEAATAVVIRSIIEAGTHPGLRWPRFPDYQADLLRLYESVQFHPIWLNGDEPTAQAETVIGVFADADADGLSAADYDAAALAREAKRLAESNDASAEERGQFDTALTVSLLRYISDLHLGRIAPHAVGFGIDVEPKKLDLPQTVAQLTDDADPRSRLAGFAPPLPIYGRLKLALREMRALAARNDLPKLGELPTLHPGESNAEMPALRKLLTALGDLRANAHPPAHPHVYDPALVQAVKRFQRRHGLDPDGVIGKGTLRALQVPLSERVVQIALAMERLRWLPYQFGDRFIIVNIPEFHLSAYESSQDGPQLVTEVVVGDSVREHETPIMSADMRYVVFRPYWNVPRSIVSKEILPKLEHDPAYLSRQNMETVNGRIRQRPGASNALGLVKFMLPNAYNVYLHDTPKKALFARSRRDFSHGCIRVANPVGLAEFVLKGADSWNRQRIEEAMREGRDNRHVELPVPVPVYLFYSTVIVAEDGQIHFFEDIYGHDETLKIALAKGYPYTY